MAAVLKETAVAVKVRTVMRLERFGKQFRIQNNLALQKLPSTQFDAAVGCKSENLVYAQAFTFSLSISSKHSQSGTYSLWCYSGVTWWNLEQMGAILANYRPGWNWKPRWLNSKFTRGSFQFVCPFSTNHLECPDIDITDTFRGGSLVSHPNPKVVVKLVQKADESSGSKMKGSAFSQRSALQSIAGEYQSWTSLHISSYCMPCTAWAGEFNPKATELRPKGHRHQNISSKKIEVLFYGFSRSHSSSKSSG